MNKFSMTYLDHKIFYNQALPYLIDSHNTKLRVCVCVSECELNTRVLNICNQGLGDKIIIPYIICEVEVETLRFTMSYQNSILMITLLFGNLNRSYKKNPIWFSLQEENKNEVGEDEAGPTLKHSCLHSLTFDSLRYHMHDDHNYFDQICLYIGFWRNYGLIMSRVLVSNNIATRLIRFFKKKH